MKMLVLALGLFVSLNVLSATTGAGFMLGNPTGAAVKHWLNDQAAVDGGFGFSFGEHTDVHIHSDYILHKKGAFYFNDVHPLDFYYGLGGRMEFADDIELGVRAPVGLVHMFTEQPVDVFAELAPVLDFISKIGVELNVSIGARYYFQ